MRVWATKGESSFRPVFFLTRVMVYVCIGCMGTLWDPVAADPSFLVAIPPPLLCLAFP
jgi:hypothetical protein